MKVWTSDIHLAHASESRAQNSQNFECPERVSIIRAELQQRGLRAFHAPEAFPIADLYRVHPKQYVDFLQSAYEDWKQLGYAEEALAPYSRDTLKPYDRHTGDVPQDFMARLIYHTLTADAAIGIKTYQAALESAHIGLSATKDVLEGSAVSFGLCRPPGHHAPSDQVAGFCYLNNIAIAAHKAIASGLSRVAVLDIDYHHGNGTQAILEDNPQIFFASLHADTRYAYPFILGHKDQTGVGAGEGAMANFPMPSYTEDDVWREALRQALVRIKDFGVEMLFVSLGVDTFAEEPISDFLLQSTDYLWCGEMIAKLGVPTVYLMEGGYNLEYVGINTANVLEGHLQA